LSNYVQSTNFATKDALSSGDPLKIVKGTEINTEFNNIATAVATKADLISPTFTGTPALPTGTTAVTQSAGNSTTAVATTAFSAAAIIAERSATATLTNKTISGGTITGITDLVVADGGTGVSALTAENVILGDGTNPVKFVAPGTSGNVLTSNGTTWLSEAFGVRIKNITFDSSSSAYSNATASATDMITVTVTPASASSKFFVVGSTSLKCTGGAGNGCVVNLVRNSTTIFSQGAGHALNNDFFATSAPITVDSPATTSSITYRVSAVRSGASSISSNTFHYSITVIEFE
jgi:hypothetical protein